MLRTAEKINHSDLQSYSQIQNVLTYDSFWYCTDRYIIKYEQIKTWAFYTTLQTNPWEQKSNFKKEGESGQINKLWHIQTMEYYSALKRNKWSSRKKMWRNLTSTLLREEHQSEETYSLIPTMWHAVKGKTKATAEISGCPGLSLGREEYVEHRGF